MSLTQTLILTIGAFQGFLLFTLLISDKRVTYASKILGVQCLFISSTFVLPLIVAAGESNFSWSISWLVFLPACYGALTYLYCRAAIADSRLRFIDIIHLVPLALCYLLNYDILLSSEKALHFVTRPDLTLFRHKLTLLVFYGQTIIYAVVLIKMIHRYQTNAKQTLSSYNPNVFKWLWMLVLFMTLIWGIKALFYFTKASPTVNIIADCLLVIMVYFIAIVQWLNPSLFHINQLSTQQVEPAASNGTKPSDGLLDQDTRSSVLFLAQTHVEEHTLYRNSELNLSSLAEQIGVSMHHLSETLNQHRGKNFNQFINEYRVAEVCQQLDKKSDRKLIDLALDAGFSSKSSFNAIFKKLTGLTPSAYRSQKDSA